MSIPLNPESDKVYVTPNVAEGIFIRSGTGPQFTPVASAFIGDALEVLDPATAAPNIGIRGEWIQVRDAKGNTGWINARFVNQVYPQAPAAGPAPGVPTQPDSGSAGAPSPQPPVIAPPTPAPPPIVPPTPLPSGQPPLYLHTTYPQGQYIRSGPGSQFPDVTSVTSDQRIEGLGDRASNLAKLGVTGEWIQVKSPDGIVGWAAAVYLEVVREVPVWTEGHALAGLHGPTEAWADRWNEDAYQLISRARIEAVKMLASNDLLSRGPGKIAEIVTRLRSIGVRFIMARLFAKFDSPKSPEDFAREVGPAAQVLFSQGVRHFEVHNEPNLNLPESPEGMFIAWQNGQQFSQFFLDAVALLKQEYDLSGAFFGFPGLSPVTFIEPQRRYLMSQFLTEADYAVRTADFVCMHTYWGGDGSTYLDSINQVRAFCQRYVNKLILVSEFANASQNVGKDVKGREYALYYTEAKKLPANLGGLFSYVMTSAGDYANQTWAGSSIPQTVGTRPVV